jgi:acetylornithine/succinyldiaminopimelate/putrescine aminotransferase
MLAFELATDFAERAGLDGRRPASLFLVDALHQEGLLTVPSGAQAVRWLPPLNVSRAEIDEAAAIVGRVLARLESRAEE